MGWLVASRSAQVGESKSNRMSGMSMMALFAVFTSTSRSSTLFYVRHLSFLCINQIDKCMQIGLGFFSVGCDSFIFLLLQMEKIRPNFKACASALL